MSLCTVYQFSNEEKYAQGAWKEVSNIMNWPGWVNAHGAQFLRTSQILNAVSIVYDFLDESERKELVETF